VRAGAHHHEITGPRRALLPGQFKADPGIYRLVNGQKSSARGAGASFVEGPDHQTEVGGRYATSSEDMGKTMLIQAI